MSAEDELENVLNCVTHGDITETKALAKPPIAIQQVLEAVCIITGVPPEKRTDKDGKIYKDYWASAKKMIADINKFLQNLRTFDKDNVPAERMEIIRSKYLTDPNFQLERMKNSSKACEGLYKWVVAMEKYDRTRKGNAAEN